MPTVAEFIKEREKASKAAPVEGQVAAPSVSAFLKERVATAPASVSAFLKQRDKAAPAPAAPSAQPAKAEPETLEAEGIRFYKSGQDWSSVRTVTLDTDDGAINFPTVLPGGKIAEPREALNYWQTQDPSKIEQFRSREEAVGAAQRKHEEHQAVLQRAQAAPQAVPEKPPIQRLPGTPEYEEFVQGEMEKAKRGEVPPAGIPTAEIYPPAPGENAQRWLEKNVAPSMVALLQTNPLSATLLYKVILPATERANPGFTARVLRDTEEMRRTSATRIPKWVPVVGGIDPAEAAVTIMVNLWLLDILGPGVAGPAGPGLVPPPAAATALSTASAITSQAAKTAALFGSLAAADKMRETGGNVEESIKATGPAIAQGFGVGLAFGTALNAGQIRALARNHAYLKAQEDVLKAAQGGDPKPWISAMERLSKTARAIFEGQGDPTGVAVCDGTLARLRDYGYASRLTDRVTEMQAWGAIRPLSELPKLAPPAPPEAGPWFRVPAKRAPSMGPTGVARVIPTAPAPPAAPVPAAVAAPLAVPPAPPAEPAAAVPVPPEAPPVAPAVTEGRGLPPTPGVLEPARMAERLAEVEGAEYQSPRVSEMKTLEVMAELKKRHSQDALKDGYERWKLTPQGQREGAGYQGEMKEAGQLETFARLLLSDSPSAVQAMAKEAPAAPPAAKVAPAVGAEPEVAPPTKPGALPKAVEAEPTPVREPLALTEAEIQRDVLREVPSDAPSILGDLRSLHRDESGAMQVPPKLPTEQEMPDAREGADPRVAEALDEWFRERDVSLQENKVQEARHQKEIAALVGEKRYGPRSRRAELLMLLYADLKGRGEQTTKWTDSLSEARRRLVAEAQNLPSGLRALADRVLEENAAQGQRALEAGVIHNVIENYAARLWEQPGKKGRRGSLFRTQTVRAKHRTLESIPHGWTKGQQLAVKTLTGAQRAATDEIANAVASRNLIKMARKAGVADTRRREGDWERIEHPNFSAWDWAGNIDVEAPLEPGEALAPGARVRALDRDNAGTVESVDRQRGTATVRFYNRQTGARATVDLPLDMLEREGGLVMRRAPDLFVTKSGDLFIRRQMYGLPEFSRFLNKILKPSILYDVVPGTAFITHYNAQIKRAILLTAFFHHQAILRSYSLGSRGIDPHRAYIEGREAVENFTPELRELVGAGLTLGELRDWDEAARSEQTRIGAFLDRMPLVSSLKAGLKKVADSQVHFLFGRWLPYLKSQAALLEYRADLEKYADAITAGEMTQRDVARGVASHINDDFGGLHLERMGRSPTAQHIMQLLLLAPDWTESNVRTAVKAFGGSLDPKIGGALNRPVIGPDGKPMRGADGKILRGPRGMEAALARQFWLRVLLKGVGLTVLSNLALSFFDDKDFWKRYHEAWKAGNLRWLDVDVTPLYRAIGGKGERRKYFSLIGHLRDPLKFIAHPIRSLKHKGSVATRVALDALFGSDWAGRRFTTWQELLGIDEKGEYKTARRGHYRAGEPKGGRLAGKLVKYGRGGRPLAWEQLPSYALYEARSALPIPAQNALGWLAGEMDAWDAILKSLGAMVAQGPRPEEPPKKGPVAPTRPVPPKPPAR